MSDAKHDNHGKKDAGHGSGGGHGDDGGHKKKKHGHGGGHGGGGHGGEEHEGAPEWLISFADMVMLMMGFFVILFAMNVQPKGGNPGGGGEQAEGVSQELNMVDLAIAVRRAFNNDVDLNSTDPKDQPLIERLKQLRAARDAAFARPRHGGGQAPRRGRRRVLAHPHPRRRRWRPRRAVPE